MRKHLPILFAISLLALAGCGKQPDDALAQNCAVPRSAIENLSFCLPVGWSALAMHIGEEENFILTIKDAGEVGTVMQIHVKKDILREPVTNVLEFAERAVAIARDSAPNYVPVSTEPITVNARETLLHVFDATPAEGAEVTRYYQFVTIHESVAYGITGILFAGENEDLRKTLVDVLTNVRFIEEEKSGVSVESAS